MARMGEGRGVYRVLVGRTEGEDQLDDQRVGGRTALKWTSGRQGSMRQTGYGWLRTESNGEFL
jgi:hypothetical protein